MVLCALGEMFGEYRKNLNIISGKMLENFKKVVVLENIELIVILSPNFYQKVEIVRIKF